ncbi:MAG TPA: cellulase family glycosylhydrolase [Abditibacteriaceae bacterium]|jgi:hypothetical protein
MLFRFFKPFIAAFSLLFAFSGAALAAPGDSLMPNGTFEVDADNNNWPDGWGQLKEGASWEKEGDNRFLRLTSPAPDKMILLYQPVNVPADAKALEISWKQRITNLKPGKQAWFDARIMLDFKDAAGNKLKGGPGAPYSRKNTEGWQEKSLKVLVPEGAKMLEFMPALFQVQSGTFDLDDIVIKPIDAAPLQEAADAANKARQEKLAKEALARQIKAEKNVGADGSIVSNGNFETDKKGAGWPDDWGKIQNGTWETENGNRFLRLTSPAPGQTVVLYRLFDIPAGWKAAELSWKQRISDLKPGQQAWFDARIMMEWKDAAGNKLNQKPAPSYSRSNTNGWVEKTTRFLIPENAVALEFMPSLFQVEKGIFDLDDITLKQTDAAPLLLAAAKAAEDAKFINVPSEAPNPARWPQELHVAGNKVLNKDGKEVWLQGVNIVSLEWNPQGERVLRSALVAIDEWKANVIRLPLKDDYWFGKKGNDGAAYRALVDSFVNLVANRGAYVILDLHQYRAPKTAHAAFWKEVAAKYKNHPAVLFDLLNEPHGISWEVWQRGGFVEDKNAPADEDNFLTPEEKALNAKGFHSVGMQALINAVRESGAKNIVLAGGLDWAYDLSGIAKGFALDDKGGNGIIYSTHIYPWKKDWQNKVLVVADKHPILVGEVGASNKKMEFIPAEHQEDAATWVPRMLGLIQKYKLHWTGWSFHPGAAPVLIKGWDYTPTPEWGDFAKRALAGEKFPEKELR